MQEWAVSVSRNATYNLIGDSLPIVLSLVTVPIYLSLVGLERYGVLAIAWLLLGYFGLFDLGLGRATSFRIASLRDSSPQARADTFWAALLVNLAMGLVGGAALWVASLQFFTLAFKVDEGLRPEVLDAIPFLAASVPIATLTGVLTGAVQGRERFLEVNIVSSLSTCVFQLLPLLVAWQVGPNLVLLLAAALFARSLAVVALAYRCYRELTSGQEIRAVRSEIVTLLKYGGWVNLTSIFGPVLVIVDRFVIGAVLGAVAVATYTVPVQLASRLAILPASLTTALFPRLSASTDKERDQLSERAMMTLAGLLCFPFVGAIFILEPFLNVWIGSKLGDDAGLIGRIVVAGMWANGLALISFTQLQASGRPDRVTKVLLVEIPPYLALLYAGSHYLGLIGCALAAAARNIVDFVLLTLTAGSFRRGWGNIAVGATILGLSVWLASLWGIRDWQWWLAAIACLTASLGFGYITTPPSVQQQLLGRVVGLLRRG
jgi:O-antigen/teichoic acid export membrane protein